jgi:AAA+ superfamily predicted ATPase
MDINDLLNVLYQAQQNQNSYLYSLRNPKKLIEALEELRDVIGNKDAKDKIAKRTISHLLRNQEYKDGKIGVSSFISNIILGGEPGSGKTHIAHKIAKIITHLDYFEHLNTAEEEDETKTRGYMEILNSPEYYTTIGLIIAGLFILCGSTIVQIITSMKSVKTMIITLLIFFLLVALAALFYLRNEKEIGNLKKVVKDINNSKDREVKVINVKRDDLVGQYVGHSQQKTLQLLNNSRGNILFFDEAYQMINSHNDSFGQEVAVAINQFMSEYPNDILFIFAGYVDKIESNLFTAQPGFRSRFTTTINCGDYSAEDLMTIYLGQLKKENKKYQDKVDKLLTFFTDNFHEFQAYGRDTARLVEHSIEECNCEAIRSEKPDTSKIKYRHVVAGLEQLKKNRLLISPEAKKRLFSEGTDLLKSLLQKEE